MICPNCAYEKTECTSSRRGLVTSRYRECPSCGCKFTTTEVVDEFKGFDPKEYNDYLQEIGELKPEIREKAKKRQSSIYDWLQ